jgi:subtilisin family serine protease
MARLPAFAAVAALAALALPGPAAALTPQELEQDGLRDIIVIREPGLSARERGDLRADAGVAHVRMMRLADTEVVRAPAGDLTEALKALNADPDVVVAEPDAPIRALTNDPGWQYLWGLENTGQPVLGVAGNSDADIDAPTAWTVSTGTGVTVAVVDTGAQLDHPDLVGQLTGNPGELGGGRETNGTDDDGNGKVDDWRGWDFVDGDNLPQDGDGHGTHVAGTIAASADNGAGVAGAAPGARVIPVRALDDNGEGYSSDIADAFAYAGALGVRVVNASLGGGDVSVAISNAIAASPNTLFVVAAGNDGTNNDNETTPAYPCNDTLANILCVGATDSTDLRASFSNWGATSVDLFAPGDSVLSTFKGSQYAYLDGTSMATPHAAGAAALVFAANPGGTVAQVRAALMSTVDVKSQLVPRSVAGGRLNVARALGITAGDGGSGGGEGPPGWTPGESQPAAPPSVVAFPSLPATPAPTVDDDERDAPAPLKLRRRGVATICLRGCASRGFELRFTLAAPAAVRTTYEARACTRRGCAWKTVARRTVRGKSGANTLKVGAKVGTKRLKRGRYRLTVAVGRSSGRATFTVR